MLWIGILIGMFLGVIVGIFFIALCISAKEGDKLKTKLLMTDMESTLVARGLRQ